VTTRGTFEQVLEWAEYDGDRLLCTTSVDEEQRWFVEVGQQLIDSGLIRSLPPAVTDTGTHPMWTLLHVDRDGRSCWCFVEQGRQGRFGAGGCWMGFAPFQAHPAEVWHAGAARAWTRATGDRPPMSHDLAVSVLAAVTADRPRIQLPGEPSDNARWIQALLTQLPPRVVAGWAWSTFLFGVGLRFIAGKPIPSLLTPEAEAQWADVGTSGVDTAHQLGALLPAVQSVANGVMGVPATWSPAALSPLLRDSRVEDLASHLREGAPAASGELELARAPHAVRAAAATVRYAPAGDVATERLPADDRHYARAVVTEVDPVVVRPAEVPVTTGLTWVEWCDTGVGFGARPDPHNPVPAEFWQAAERLLDAEKVPQDVDQTLRHPLWTLRAVRVDGHGDQWCFIERGRGIRLDGNGVPASGPQFGIAGGCRFGFAPIRASPSDVWRAGARQAWTRATPAQPERAPRMAELLAGVATGKPRIRLDDDPARNAVVIDQLLAVLPRTIVADRTWSTCLFRPVDAFVAGPPPWDLVGRDGARLVRRFRDVSSDVSGTIAIHGLNARKHKAFLFLADAAEQAAVSAELPSLQLARLVRASRADSVVTLLAEMVETIDELRMLRPDEITAAIQTRGKAAALAREQPAAFRQWVVRFPTEACKYLLGQPEREVLELICTALVAAQTAAPSENLILVPVSRAIRTEHWHHLVRCVAHYGPPVATLEEMVEALTRTGGLLNDYNVLVHVAPWLNALGLGPATHLHLHPKVIVDSLVGDPEVPVRMVEALMRTVDPAMLATRVYQRRKPKTADQAVAILYAVHAAVYSRSLARTRFRQLVDKTVARRMPRARRQLLLENLVALSARWPANDQQRDDFLRELLRFGGPPVVGRDQSRPIISNELARVCQRIGLEERTSTGEPLYQPRPAGGSDPTALETGLFFTGDRRTLLTLVALVIVGVMIITLVPFLFSGLLNPQPGGEPRKGSSSAVPARSSARASVEPTVVLVRWVDAGSDGDVAQRVRTVTEGRQVVAIGIVGHGVDRVDGERVANGVREALLKAKIGTDITIDGRPARDGHEPGQAEVAVTFG
jgi:hypothetical protein